MSMDGRIGLKNGKSKWVTNNYSRSVVHSLRAECDAIIVGGNTLRKDNPFLTSRSKKSPEPLRVVFTKTLNLPRERNLWNCDVAKTLVVYDESSANPKYLDKLPSGVEFAKVPSDNPRLLSQLLAERGLNKILWECGPNLATSAIKNGCIQETIAFIAPKILGGESSMTPFADFNFEDMSEVKILNKGAIKMLNDDIFIKNYI
tara:strand:- start:1387 stop:1995 length:609 start_codon:yes stop_codon:yes gene_type:complete